ncbi:MAG: hypothetical protein K6T90_19045 [Leptolyngbyaceae cyanobacterium HOT.MB2.61]|nr:hypothetical protein [Leptolyngbyaceae cyanobacterium HOT.MB2.61]
MNPQTAAGIDLQQLSESRVQLHYAIQLIAATGAALAEPQPDYSHTSLSWNPQLKLFSGTLIPSTQPFRVALEPINLTSMILNSQGNEIATFPLSHQTLQQGLDWLKAEIAKRGANADQVAFLSYPPGDFPEHAIAHGAPFSNSQDLPFKNLVSFYAVSHTLLEELSTRLDGASPVRIWPHHFDIATLITLPNDSSQTIGVGMSPGDSSYNEPYWYVSPYPYPDTSCLPNSEGSGFWHTSHWVGAVLTTSQLTNSGIESNQPQVQTFLNSAIKASRGLLARS